ncbi:MAG: NAD-dependent epimerase/dehydratase family protein [Negativicutes bacterium]|nr:NAD-dependent epimerase/dehydratase family protein [Negativicutes bacterium]
MKVLVTGGAGFIGSHVVAELLRRDYQVVIVDNLSTGLLENIDARASFHKLDVTADDLNELFAGEKVDFVIHLAAQTAVPRSLAEPEYDCQANILGTVKVMEAARKNGVRRVIFASSAAVYGDGAAIPISEDAHLDPASFYGLSKLTAEKYLKLYSKVFDIEYVVLRYANVYGERQGDAGEGGVVSIFARKVLAGQPISIFGDGGQTRDFIYAGDIAAANCQALVTRDANTVYNISTGTETSVNELVELMAAAAGRRSEKRYLPAREGDIYRSLLDNRAACKCLDWQPAVGLADGLAATYRFLQQKEV